MTTADWFRGRLRPGSEISGQPGAASRRLVIEWVTQL
jgi:hypothetical protein